MSAANSRNPSRRLGSIGAMSAALMLTVIAWSAPVMAQSSGDTPTPVRAVAPARGDQQALAMELSGGRELLAQSCAKTEDCTPEGGVRIRLGEDVLPHVKNLTMKVVRVGAERHLIEVAVPDPSRGTYLLWMTGPTSKSGIQQPQRIWSGWVDDKGARPDDVVHHVERTQGGGNTQLTLTKSRARAALCGRAAPLEQLVLRPDTMKFGAASRTNPLSPEEQKNATPIALSAIPSGAPPALSVLFPEAASFRGASKLLDGDRGTALTLERPDGSQGEYATFFVDPFEPITGIDLWLPEGAPPDAASLPAQMWLVTDGQVFALSSAPSPSALGFRLELNPPIKTSCLGLVFGPKSEQRPSVSIGEIVARTSLDGESAADVMQQLDGPAERADRLSDLLVRSANRGAQLAIDHYESLSAPAQARARVAIDAADCTLKAPFYVSVAARTKDPYARRNAERNVQSCGADAAASLVAMLAAEQDEVRISAARELALMSPAKAVEAISGRLSGQNDRVRRSFRESLGAAIEKSSSETALKKVLLPEGFSSLELVGQIDLLRAASSKLSGVAEGAAAFDVALAKSSTFRDRYLLLEPAAALASTPQGKNARAFLGAALADADDHHLRARAAEVSFGVTSMHPELVRASADPSVRVRDAAIRSLTRVLRDGAKQPEQGSIVKAAVNRLEADKWTFVRRSSVRLLEDSKTAGVDLVLARTMRVDPSPLVRIDAIGALGRRGATGQAEAIRKTFEDHGELVDVRIAAIRALAAMCDRGSVEAWTGHAQRAAFAANAAEFRFGLAALVGLAQINPPDLAERVKPLLDPRVAFELRDYAREASKPNWKGTCAN